MNFPYCAAHTLISGGDPYTICPPGAGSALTTAEKLRIGPTNPITAALPFLLLLPLPLDLAASLFIGLSSALLVFGLTRTGQYWRLLVFLSFPYWYAVLTIQWA